MRLVDVIVDLGRRLAHLDLDWGAAKSYAAAHRGIVDPTTLQQASAELGDGWAASLYETGRTEALIPEEIFVDDQTLVQPTIQLDRLATESVSVGYATVNQVILQLVALRDADADVGHMRCAWGPQRADVTKIEVETARSPAASDDDFVVVIR